MMRLLSIGIDCVSAAIFVIPALAIAVYNLQEMGI